MKVILAEHYGTCFGVRDAIAAAKQAAQSSPVTILGELVHNPDVRRELQSRGAIEGSLDAPAATRQVLITAHGASDSFRTQLSASGHSVTDTTCPLVRHAHSQLRTLAALGFLPVVIGNKQHAEVRGLTGDFPEAVVIESETDIVELPDSPRYGVISQTTQQIDRVRALVALIRAARPSSHVRFVDTVCKPTKDRQTAMEKLIGQVEAVVVVGGCNSNNTRQLVRRASEAGLRTFHVESAADLVPSWFQGIETIGLTAGTSTPEESVQSVRAALELISAAYACGCAASEVESCHPHRAVDDLKLAGHASPIP